MVFTSSFSTISDLGESVQYLSTMSVAIRVALKIFLCEIYNSKKPAW